MDAAALCSCTGSLCNGADAHIGRKHTFINKPDRFINMKNG
jgi:hypothetical protein